MFASSSDLNIIFFRQWNAQTVQFYSTFSEAHLLGIIFNEHFFFQVMSCMYFFFFFQFTDNNIKPEGNSTCNINAYKGM